MGSREQLVQGNESIIIITKYIITENQVSLFTIWWPPDELMMHSDECWRIQNNTSQKIKHTCSWSARRNRSFQEHHFSYSLWEGFNYVVVWLAMIWWASFWAMCRYCCRKLHFEKMTLEITISLIIYNTLCRSIESIRYYTVLWSFL